MILWLLAATDLLLVNGRVHTFDPAHPEAEALLVRGDRILAVGRKDELEKRVGLGTRVLDLGGRAVLPGLIDTHTHLFAAMESRVRGDLDLGVSWGTGERVGMAFHQVPPAAVAECPPDRAPPYGGVGYGRPFHRGARLPRNASTPSFPSSPKKSPAMARPATA